MGKDRANVVAYLTVFHHMSAPTGQKATRQEAAWPDNTYSTPQKKLTINDEPVLIMHFPSNTDGNSIVHFRTSDVVSVGDLLDLTGYSGDRRESGREHSVRGGEPESIDRHHRTPARNRRVARSSSPGTGGWQISPTSRITARW